MQKTITKGNNLMADNLYIRAHKTWGKDEFVMLMEECGELIQQASKMYRGNGDIERFAEEIADVEIMILQMKYVFAGQNIQDLIDIEKEGKLKRLRERVHTAEEKGK
jgi:NTP pyrophosphatase (non-canonical NTP hydrolase)